MPDQLRLLVLTHNYPRWYGDHAGIFVSLLCRRLIEHSIQPIVLAPHDAGAPEYEENSGVVIHRFRYGSDEEETLAYRGNMHQIVTGSLTGLTRFRRYLRTYKHAAMRLIEDDGADVIAGHWLVPAALVMRSFKENLPMILSSHGSDIRLIGIAGGLPYKYLKSFCRRLSRWTFVSSYLRDQVLKMDSQLSDQLEVLPLPHDETIFRIDPSVSKEEYLIVAVTRFTEQKRVGHLIDSFRHVYDSTPEARMEIYGVGPLKSQIESKIQSLALTNRITIHEPIPQDELRVVYNRASVVVLNSCREGFGLALSEAMLCGTAVVGVDSGGIPDIIEHEKRGLLAPPDNSEALAEALGRMLSDRTLRQKLAQAGHEFAIEHYASGPLAKRYAEIVYEAAGRNRSL